jgi:AcrR family transcriptional regulator
MSDMSTAYEESGRTRQKARTRNELIAATRALIESGSPSPTVEQAAERASVSRTTAYRYFPSQAALLIAAHPEIDESTLLPDDAGDDPVARLHAAIDRFVGLVLETEGQQRTMLRLSLESDHADLPLRQGRAIGWFVDALAPLEPRLGKAEIRRVAVAVRSATGIEALVWLTDIAGLSRKDAGRQLRWSGRAILAYALAEGPPG